ncbi:MAG TPA: M61 family peptidase [Verrucomicrobiae bacterium]|nr:M61 family peptidase [Verrucomicrobiae bacterium]
MVTQRGWFWYFSGFNLWLAVSALAQTAPVRLDVDATDAPRGLLHARLHIPAGPGQLTLFYPKWIPGDHMPDGPINNVTGLEFSANGKPLDWRRDDEDMFTFHLELPAGADGVDVSLDFLLPGSGGSFSAGVSSTAKLLDLNWNQVLLYPQTSAPLKLPFVATLKLPAGWKFGTALPIGISTRNQPGEVEFLPAPLETLIDSPVIAGEYFRVVDLSSGQPPVQVIDIVADSAAALEMKPEEIRHFSHLVTEANALFGAHHYRDYHFLLTLSDRVAHFGLEHHESSDDRLGENYLTDDSVLRASTDLMPHEMAHSWNGKYRRPAGLATPDYQQPMHDELLWVYEGLTDYLGKLLAARSGLQTNDDFRETFALTAAMLDHRTGREWRSLADTAVAAQLLYDSPPDDVSRRRSTDFYPEGDLIWLDADVRIRQQTHGEKSLDDFCKLFHGGESGPPKVVPYTYDDVMNALNKIAPGDWNAFFQQRVYEITPRAPLGGIENGGWRLAYTNEEPALLKTREGQRKFVDLSYSIGLNLGTDGEIHDVVPGTPAEAAGIGSGMKLVAVDGRAWSAEILRAAVKAAATNTAPIELLVANGDYYKTFRLDCHGGEKYPCLERDPARPDLLDEIIRPLTPETPVASTAGQ